MDPHALGRLSEEIAAKHLESEGFEILQRNFRIRRGEIDLIAQRGEVLYFCEVKGRRGQRFGHPREAVSFAQRRRVNLAARVFLARSSRQWSELGFCLVTVSWHRGLATVKVIPQAFDGEP